MLFSILLYLISCSSLYFWEEWRYVTGLLKLWTLPLLVGLFDLLLDYVLSIETYFILEPVVLKLFLTWDFDFDLDLWWFQILVKISYPLFSYFIDCKGLNFLREVRMGAGLKLNSWLVWGKSRTVSRSQSSMDDGVPDLSTRLSSLSPSWYSSWSSSYEWSLRLKLLSSFTMAVWSLISSGGCTVCRRI